MFFEQGVYKLAINDRPESRSCFVSSTSLSEAFLIADRGLRTGGLRWRAYVLKGKPGFHAAKNSD